MIERETTREPDWSICSTSGCIGARVDGQEACLAHVDTKTRNAILAALKPGADLDVRGTPISSELLAAILAATREEDGPARLADVQANAAQFNGNATFHRVQFGGTATFHEAQFSGNAEFHGAQFSKDAEFDGAQFTGDAMFHDARFSEAALFDRAHFEKAAWFASGKFGGNALFREVKFNGGGSFHYAQFRGGGWFSEAQFSKDASFDRAQFSVAAVFHGVQFSGNALFRNAVFDADTWFSGAQFDGVARFEAAQFSRAAWFDETQFRRTERLGPLLVATRLIVDRASFERAILVEAVTRELSCVGARFMETADIRLRWAAIVLDGAMFTKPSTFAYVGALKERQVELGVQRAEPEQRNLFDESAVELPEHDAKPRLLSIRGVDVSNLVLSEIDLKTCLFWGAHHLDQLRIEGPNPFSTTPRGWQFGRVGGQGLPVWRWTRRQTVAEEHLWRASRPLPDAPNGRPHPKRAGWRPPPAEILRRVEAQSGQPIQQVEADHLVLLYRRLRKGREDNKNEPGAADFYYGEMEMRRRAVETPWPERVILTLYWLVSGYGLRGLRALTWLAVVVVGLAVLLQAIGFNGGDPPFRDALIYAAQSTVSLPSSNRALIDHVSWAGELQRIVLRLVGPLLLGLALLSVRNRVKR